MSLLNDASLVMIPSGYKDTKLYSVKPTNGDGDFTFSRGSNLAATRVNSEGLIEKGRENLLLQSNSFDTTWSLSNASVTGGQSGYDGSSDAWLFTTTVAGATVQQSFTSTGVLTYSVYAKAGSVNGIRLRIDATSDANGYYDLVNGTIYSSEGIDASISNVGNGWYKCSLSQNVSGAVKIQFFTTDGTTSYDNGNIYIQDAQLEQGLVATDYIETTTTTEQAGILEDMPRLDYSGGATCPALKLEPQRSNLITQSEYGGDYLYVNTSYVQNTQVSPEGVINSITIESDTTNSSHYFGSNFNFFTSGTTYTSSVFIKKGTGRYFQLTYGFSSFGTDQYANYDLQDGVVTYEGSLATASIEDFGNGWYRCVLTATATSNFNDRFYAVFITSGTASRVPSHSSSLNYYFYGFQMEEGSYATSYIPTYGGSSVTRSDEYFNTSVDLQTEGILSSTWTFLYDQTFVDVPRDNAAAVFLIQDSSGNSARISLSIDGSLRLQISRVGIIATTSGNKILGRYDGSSVEFFVDGVSVGSGSALPNEFDNLNEYNPSTETSKIIKLNQILIFPTALTDAECIQLTT